MDYSQRLIYAFKRFSVLSAFKTALPTIGVYLHPRPLPPSEKPALFTMNILPPMVSVWHYFARKALGDSVDIVIFDCSGTLQSSAFPGCRVQRFLNPRAAQKCDVFLQRIARNRKIAWMCDDDVFILERKALTIVEREMQVPNTAAVSFESRNWWHFTIDGVSSAPLGTYCLALNRDIVWEKEHLSCACRDGNEHPSHIAGKAVKRYDTFDYANEQLLRRGYRCVSLSPEERKGCYAGFDGVSNGVMILSLFKFPEETLEYLSDPPLKQWSGNILFRVLNALLCISAINDLYSKIHGKVYPLPSLPSRDQLEKLVASREKYLRPDVSFQWMRETEMALHAAM